MKIGLARCSTVDQDPSLQEDALRKAGCERIYVETASGTKAERPVLAEVLGALRSGDVLVVYSLSRLARSVRQLIEIGDVLRTRDFGIVSLTKSINTTWCRLGFGWN